MTSSLANSDFTRSVYTLRRILPMFSFGLLIGTYLVSAIIMGLFHAKGAESIGFIIAAFVVPLAIQAGRGTLVFFFQLNPARLQRKLSFGILAATVLLILSLFEACLVMWPYGLPWTVSVATLMIIGWIIEVMILKETQFTSELELYGNLERLEELKKFHIAKKEFAAFLETLEEEEQTAIQSHAEESISPTREKRKLPKQTNNHKTYSRLGKPIGQL